MFWLFFMEKKSRIILGGAVSVIINSDVLTKSLFYLSLYINDFSKTAISKFLNICFKNKLVIICNKLTYSILKSLNNYIKLILQIYRVSV